MKLSLTFALIAALVSGCGASTNDPGADGDPLAQTKCLNSSECCFSDDDCGEGEFCQGDGACDSEGTCEPISLQPCGLSVDPETGEPAMPVCGCDGVTYQGACMATSSGHRIAYDGACVSAPFGDMVLRVDTGLGGLEQASMDADFSCYAETDSPGQSLPEIFVSGALELRTGDDGRPRWEGVFDLPFGACTATLTLRSNGEVLCLGSQSLTVEGDTALDVVLVCSLGPSARNGK